MSDDKAEELKKNILSPSQWIRIIYMAFYAVACWLMTIVLSVIIVAQILISLITGEDNENLRTVGKKVSDYFHELLDFLVYASNDKPWPFSDTDITDDSEPDDDDTDEPGVATEAPAGNAAERKPPQASTAAREPEDDVFADISFTDSDEAETGNNENDDNNDDNIVEEKKDNS